MAVKEEKLGFVRTTELAKARFPTRVRVRVEGNGQSLIAIDEMYYTAGDAVAAVRRLERDLRGRGEGYRLVIGVPTENAPSARWIRGPACG